MRTSPHHEDRGLEDTLCIPKIYIVDNRDIADAMKKLEQSEKSRISHV